MILSDFVIAGGLSSIVAGQAARSSALLFSGHADQIISSFAQPGDVLNDFTIGAVLGGIGYGIKGLIETYRDVMSISIGVPDEFMSSSMQSGEFQPITVNPNSTSTAIVPYDSEFAATQMNQGAKYYVRPNGEAIPATGYRYSSGSAFYDSVANGAIPPKPNGTYISFNYFAEGGGAGSSLQMPYLPKMGVSFNTLQIIDDIRIPYGMYGTSDILEPIAIGFPDFGVGSATQAITFSPIQIDTWWWLK